MTIELLNSENAYLWGHYVNNHKYGTIYYTLKFRDLIAKVTNATPLYFMAIEESRAVGILPLMQKEGSLGKVINSLPFYGSHGGVLADNKNAQEFLLDHYIEIVSNKSVTASTLIENLFSHNNSLYSRINVNEYDSRIGQLTNLEGNYLSLEELMECFHTKTRNTIRKAAKSEVVVSVENNMFQFLEEIHIENMRVIGGLAKSHLFFEQVQTILNANDDYKIYVARYQGMPIAALLNLYCGKVVEYFTPVINQNYRNLQPMSLLIAHAMLDASNDGFKWWNWGGTWSSQEGVYKFKSRWGTQDFKYNYYVTVNNENIYESKKEKILKEYEGFYVVPFNKLKNQ